MKPQCTTAAECFKEVGRVMEQFNCQTWNTAASRGLIKQNGCDSTLTPYNAHKLLFLHPEEWQFALAEVEGKPVFIGDELYSTNTGRKFQVHSTRVSNGALILRECYGDGHNEFPYVSKRITKMAEDLKPCLN